MSLFKSSIRRHADIGREGCVLQTNMEETMDNFQSECKRALWHAYAMLDPTSTDQVHVSQLRVITSNIGLRLGFDQSEEILNKYGATTMSFSTYHKIFKAEIIDKQDDVTKNGGKTLGERLNDVTKTCWRLCSFVRSNQSTSMTVEHCLTLWRLFNTLSEVDETGEPVVPVKLHCEEVTILLREFIDRTGQRNKEQAVQQLEKDRKDDPLFTFTEFLDVFERDFVNTLSKNDISLGMNQLYDKYILNVLGKGMMQKRGHNVKSWKERWLVLTPTQLKYYVSKNERVLKGTIDIDSDCKVEVVPDRPGHHPNKFVLSTNKKPYEISAPDLKTKNEWVSGLQVAMEHVGKNPNIQSEAAKNRCIARLEKVKLAEADEKKRKEEAEDMIQRHQRLEEENRIRLENEENIRKKLQEEELKRKEAEARVEEEQRLREEEQQRLRELEDIKRELERLLEEERQAKRDEEIVRNLQAQILEQEFERRAELEKLQAEQQKMLEMEREQKAVLESDRQEQERRLEAAKSKLDELEREKTDAAEKMEEAAVKLQKAEKERHLMEEKVKLWKTPVGLARPVQVKVDPHITHRGLGAFCKADFRKRSVDGQHSPDSSQTEQISKKDNDSHPGKEENIGDVTDKDSQNQDESTTKAEDTKLSENISVENTGDSGASTDTNQNTVQSTEEELAVTPESNGLDHEIKEEPTSVENDAHPNVPADNSADNKESPREIISDSIASETDTVVATTENGTAQASCE